MEKVIGIIVIALLVAAFVYIVRFWDPDETCDPGEHCKNCMYFPCEGLTKPDDTEVEIMEK